MGLAGVAETITKRIRRRGRKLVETPYIASTNDRNEFCKVILQRDTPFRSASTDVGHNWGRCNIDFQFMPRTLDPDQLVESSAAQPAVLQVNPKDALAMYGVRMQMPDAPMLRRCFHALVAMFQAAHNCDFYITKYHAKPMEQLQSLLSNIALGLRRLEAEDEAAALSAPAGAGAEQPEERARKATLKIATAANRSSWCSCCEMATFIKTGALVRKTHRPIAIFLSRPLYLYEQCRRFLQRSHEMLIEAPVAYDDQVRAVDVLRFTAADADRAVQLAELQTDADNDSNHADSSSLDEHDLFDDSGAHEDANPEPETVPPGEGRGESSRAAQPANQADNEAGSVEQIL